MRATATTTSIKFERLRLFNTVMALLHAVQGLVILLLSTDFTLPITTSFLVFDEQVDRLVPEENTLFDLRIAPLVAAFLFISAIDHAVLSLPRIFPRGTFETCVAESTTPAGGSTRSARR